MKKIVLDLPDTLAEKWRLKKAEDGYGDKKWEEYIRYWTREISIEQSVSELLTGSTRENLAKLWMQNFAANIAVIRNSKRIFDAPKSTKPVLVVGAGPSVKARGHLDVLVNWILADPTNRDKIVIMATDRMLIPLIQKGIHPDYAVTVDGNREKIVKWYDSDEVQRSTVKGVFLSITVAQNVGELLAKKEIPTYWFTAMLDNFNLSHGITKLMFYATDAAAVNCGGNAGTAGWAIANYLNAPQIALIGLDFGYLEGTPIEQTAYYETLQQLIKSNPSAINGFYFDDFNPDFGVKCYSDVMFKHYKTGFVEMLSLSKIPTVNCFLPGTMVSAPIPSVIESGPTLVAGMKGGRFPAKLQKRQYHGTVLSIKPRCGIPLEVTPEHPFLTIKREYHPRSREGRYELHQKRGFRPEWITASNLSAGDILLSTEVAMENHGYSKLSLKNGRSREHRFPHWLYRSDELDWLIGLYTGDGSTSQHDRNTAHIALPVEASNLIERTRTILSDLFGLDPSINEHDGCSDLRIHSADFVDNFKEWCGSDTYTKHLPQFASKSSSALRGLLDADGWRGDKETVLTTVSPSLAFQVFNLYLSRKEHPSIRVRPESTPGYPNRAKTYEVGISNGDWHYTRWWRWYGQNGRHTSGRDYYLMPITTIESKRYDGPVFNLNVQNDHTYLANWIVCHNCTEGGIVYGTGIKGMKFADWLKTLENSTLQVAPKEESVSAQKSVVA